MLRGRTHSKYFDNFIKGLKPTYVALVLHDDEGRVVKKYRMSKPRVTRVDIAAGDPNTQTVTIRFQKLTIG